MTTQRQMWGLIGRGRWGWPLAGALAVAAALLLVLPTRAPVGQMAADVCTVPADIADLDAPLPRTGDVLRRERPLTIVAIGSSSTEGVGASAPERTYPSRLAAELAARFPRSAIRVVNTGRGGERTPQMLARFDRDVLAEKPDLVLWQAGSNSVLHGVEQSLDDYRQLIRIGVSKIRKAGAEIILINPQYAPRFTAKANHLDMVRAMAEVAREKSVPLFDRFAVMRHWIVSKQMGQAQMLSPDRLHMNDLSYGCVGRLLAEAIARQVDAD